MDPTFKEALDTYAKRMQRLGLLSALDWLKKAGYLAAHNDLLSEIHKLDAK